MRIGDYDIHGQVLFAPMAGVSDRPCRQISVQYGAALATSEMLISDTKLWNSAKSRTRLDFRQNPGLISVQIAGADPSQMADAARALAERGAQIIDINLGCPAKKVCGAASGSALLKDLSRVRTILRSVVAAVPLPVTLKTRTGWDADHLTAVDLAQMAQAEGIQALALHGRTRAQHFKGQAEHDTLKRVRDAVDMPLIANGDIRNAAQAKHILSDSGADAVMIGRAAQGNPWLIEQVHRYLSGDHEDRQIPATERLSVIQSHLQSLYHFYGEWMGVLFARKHLNWYWQAAGWPRESLGGFYQLETPELQLAWIQEQAA